MIDPSELGWRGDPALLIEAAGLIIRPPAWHSAAACRRAENGDVNFFPGFSERAAAPAKAVCATCPVVDDCRRYVAGLPPREVVGVWAGTSDGDRRAAREGTAA